MTASNGYPRGDLLVETDWLAEHVQDAGVRLVDCGSADAYQRAHIPGAAGLGGVNPFLKDPAKEAHVMPAEQVSALMGRLGIGDNTLVIAYDDNNALQAGRFWWVLQHYGHTTAKVLNGGWRRWAAEGRAVSTDPVQPQAATFTPRRNDEVICRLDDLRAAIHAPETAILDVRSEGEYAGTDTRGNKRAGHVPGAAHIEWLEFMTKDGRSVFRPAEEIERLLQHAGVRRDRPVITYCQGGIRAAHAMFVLALMGYGRVRNYDASMREWANRDDTPLELPG